MKTEHRLMVIAVRAMHGAITAWFLGCLALLWYSAITRRQRRAAWLAAGALAVEGVVVGVNGGECPLGGVHRRFGDEKTFFELLLPPRAAKAAVPVLGSIAGAGIALLAVRKPRYDESP